LDEDLCYLGLAGSEKKPAERYKTWVRNDIPVGEWELISKVLQRGPLTGSS